MKVRDLLKQMQDDGWYLARQRGSHRQMKHPDKPQAVTVPGPSQRRVQSEDVTEYPQAGGVESMTRCYLVIYENGPHNWSGFAPDVPGCASTGHSIDEMRANLREAIEFHLEGLQLDGLALPGAVTRLVEVLEDGLAEWLDVSLPAIAAISA